MANLITLSRFPLFFLYLALMYFGGETAHLWNVPFIILIFSLDTLDGWVARRRNEASLLGSVFDIATDRTLEYVLWVVYAHLGLISVLVPIIVLIRGTSVDAVRSIGMKKGVSAFEQLQSPINRFLVRSRFMRAMYGTVKAAAAALLTLSYALPPDGSGWTSLIYQGAMAFTWISVIVCVVRGVPVLIEGIKSISSEQFESK
ncbi:MAG: CDP-alcohol phosphatidyltransferase family protein [Anaerolineales bacterium]|nr:CDP-alcohol phosphatidyltransferase family protein [Anaerolineales bacterium]